jgi:8-oxo-dGTP pyrophosphatase MutT (NUDIX family)
MAMSIQNIYEQYLEVFPQELEALSVLGGHLQKKGEDGIKSRKTFDDGHITAGAIIVSVPSGRVLMLDHLALGKRLQPGGHVEPEDENVLNAAYRECEEETGIGRDQLTYIPLSEQNVELPFNIWVQDIPENPAKDEPAHRHYDFWYLFTVSDGVVASSSDEGVANHQWVPMAEFAEDPDFSRQAEKIEKLLLA